MEKTLPTPSEAIAARNRFPQTLFGFTPNERAYWAEPGLPWAHALLNPEHFGLDPEACARELQGLFSLPLVWNENMAPRFPHGTWLAGRVVDFSQEIAVGEALAVMEPGEAADCYDLARVAEIGPGWLLLRCDNGGHETRLAWPNTDPARNVWRITHYVMLPTV